MTFKEMIALNARAISFINKRPTMVLNHPDYSIAIGTRADRIVGIITPERVVNIWCDIKIVPTRLHYMARKGKVLLGALHLHAETHLVEDFKQNDHLCVDLADINYISDARMHWDTFILKHLKPKTNKK